MLHVVFMAWRIDEQVVRGEIDCRERGRVTGAIWLVGRAEPVRLELAGCPWCDLAGHVVKFTHASPRPGDLSGLADLQRGLVGDLTVSRKVRIPSCSKEEFGSHLKAGTSFPWSWGNAVYLEWFSDQNGRVVIATSAYRIEIEAGATWSLMPGEEQEQREANARALDGYMARLGEMLEGSNRSSAGDVDDPPQSAAEAEADARQRHMDRLLDRISARMDREGARGEDFETVLREERERLQRECGEHVVENTSEQEAARAAWMEELNAAAQAAKDEAAGEAWKDDDWEDRRHPLVERCSELGSRVSREIQENRWLPGDAGEEHPLREIPSGIWSAGAKLAGALGATLREEPWPPPALFAGDTLVRLKKARGYLGDALRAIDAARADHLATPVWCDQISVETRSLLASVLILIRQVREVLKDSDDDAGLASG